MRRTTAERKEKAKELVPDPKVESASGSDAKVTKTRRTRKPAASVTAELPPELPPELPGEKSQTGSSDTRVSRLSMTGFENIIESTFTFDPDTALDEVKACLTLSQKASRTEYGELVDALDLAEESARKALLLVVNSKVACANYLSDVDIIKSELHEQSVREMMLRHEDPDDKAVTRKPTKDDVEAYKVSTYHDEWSDIEERSQKAKRTVDYLEGLFSLSAQRARDLRQMVASSRG